MRITLFMLALPLSIAALNQHEGRGTHKIRRSQSSSSKAVSSTSHLASAFASTSKSSSHASSSSSSSPSTSTSTLTKSSSVRSSSTATPTSSSATRVVAAAAYDYYHGGKFTGVRFRGLSTANNAALFYTDSNCIADYNTYVKAFAGRKNTYNGLLYSNDPTIAVWETGNELGGYIGAEGYPPVNWTTSATSQILASAPHQLIMDGTNGIYNYTTKATAPGLGVQAAQLMSDHGYPRNIALLKAEVPLTNQHNKGFLIGEYDWTDNFGGDTLANYISYIESTGTYLGERTNRAVPSALVGVKCPQPVF
ncbi:hypothetical protein P7C70_g3441, partial [Phenoliferia sp. Uapishka_3]